MASGYVLSALESTGVWECISGKFVGSNHGFIDVKLSHWFVSSEVLGWLVLHPTNYRNVLNFQMKMPADSSLHGQFKYRLVGNACRSLVNVFPYCKSFISQYSDSVEVVFLLLVTDEQSQPYNV